MLISEFKIILPELILVLIALIGQLICVFVNKPKITTNFFIIGALALSIFIINSNNGNLEGFNRSFAVSNQINILKSIILGFVIAVIFLYQDFCDITNTQLKSEFITLLLLSVVGIFLSISARNFLLLFCALELQALTSYALAAFNIKSLKSSEGALKYFILGALISALSAFGISFIYGFGGSLYFADISYSLDNYQNIGLIVGLILVLISIFFKLSVAPLHFWTPDVYEGSPIASVSYFTTAAKFGSLVVLINLLKLILHDYYTISINLVKIVAIFSMVIGALGALGQNSLKRLMAYGTILNIGYSLIAISLNNEKGYEVALINMFIYSVSILGFFALLVAMLGNKSDDANFDDIQGAAGVHKAIAAGILIIMFSMIGIPPFAGFFGKYYIFFEAVNAGEYTLVLVGITTSVISSYYYLKVIKALYFTNSIAQTIRIPTRGGLLLISVITISFIILAPILFANFLI